jgi:pantoate--beta-alanine ligase
MVQPEVAIFGAKDYQQAAVVRRLVADLNMPVRIEVAPTVREPDGLAMSSRNAYLSSVERSAATVLNRALEAAAAAVRHGERRTEVLESLLAAEVGSESLARLQYAAAVDPETLVPVIRPGGAVLLALAAVIGKTRLIDNVIVEGN